MEYATVVGGSLNLRQETDTKSTRITSIPNGSTVAVIEKGTEWCKIVYNAYTGYVMAKFLQFSSESDDDLVTISVSKESATEMYEALKLSLDKE